MTLTPRGLLYSKSTCLHSSSIIYFVPVYLHRSVDSTFLTFSQPALIRSADLPFGVLLLRFDKIFAAAIDWHRRDLRGNLLFDRSSANGSHSRRLDGTRQTVNTKGRSRQDSSTCCLPTTTLPLTSDHLDICDILSIILCERKLKAARAREQRTVVGNICGIETPDRHGVLFVEPQRGRSQC